MKMDFRKRLLVYPELQRRLIAYMMWLGLIIVIIHIIGSLFFLSNTIATLHAADLSSEAEVSSVIVQIWLKASLITLASVVGVIAVFSYFSLRFSNKIAGPTLQMKNKLANYIQNDDLEVIKLREKDYFKDLAELINQALAKNSGSDK
jgi:ABC-type multidrug transport system permease subunit